MAEKQAQVKVFKFDPVLEKRPRYVRYLVPYNDGATVLDVLKYIQEHLDAGLAFRYGCEKGKCGSCPVEVNGRPVFSCHEPASDRMVIRPHRKFRVIRDLVVDFEAPLERQE
ncbi:MAG: 2Fe-2S iron-sulfur cluster-binding protein [Dehalococcoidia bacterium]|nr:2Fe-2S iron-sulfur cluster-binding protein [Dehalococcoidia bacterium]